MQDGSIGFSLDRLVLYLSYSGSAVGVLLAYKLFKMENLTFINQMFLLYFCVDSVIGLLQTFSIDKLQKEKWVIYKTNKFLDALL